MIVDGSDSAGNMSAVTITILVPWEIAIVTSDRNTLQVFMGDQKSSVNDTDSTVGTSEGAHIYNAVAVGIPCIARSHHVYAVQN